jgi:hypothetical protein
MVLANQPGQATKTVSLPSTSSWTDLAGNTVTSVTLDGRRGKVLIEAGATGEPAPAPTPTEEPTDPTGTGKNGKAGSPPKGGKGPKPKG